MPYPQKERVQHASIDIVYSPGEVVSVEYQKSLGDPKEISTSFIERQNLTIRMQQRRFTRLTNAFSKKYEHHVAAFALYAAWYNLCRVHETLKITRCKSASRITFGASAS